MDSVKWHVTLTFIGCPTNEALCDLIDELPDGSVVTGSGEKQLVQVSLVVEATSEVRASVVAAEIARAALLKQNSQPELASVKVQTMEALKLELEHASLKL